MIIGLAGRAQVGKNTTAQRIKHILEQEYPEIRYSEFAFADALKQSAAACLSISVEELEYLKLRPEARISVDLSGFEEPVYGSPGEIEHTKVNKIAFSGRKFLQVYGTEAHRDVFGQDIWTDIVMGKIYDLVEGSEVGHQNHVSVITDVRYDNEVEAIYDSYPYEGEIWHIDTRQMTFVEFRHPSEAGLSPDSFAHVVYNDIRDDDYESLDRQIHARLSVIFGSRV